MTALKKISKNTCQRRSGEVWIGFLSPENLFQKPPDPACLLSCQYQHSGNGSWRHLWQVNQPLGSLGKQWDLIIGEAIFSKIVLDVKTSPGSGRYPCPSVNNVFRFVSANYFGCRIFKTCFKSVHCPVH